VARWARQQGSQQVRQVQHLRAAQCTVSCFPAWTMMPVKAMLRDLAEHATRALLIGM
jgi:hypothetical protein